MIAHGEKEETPINTDYEEAFGTAIALLEECSYAIGEEAYKAKRIAQKALEAWGEVEKKFPIRIAKDIAKAREAAETYSEACHLEAFSNDLLSRYFQEKARRGQNPKAEIEAIFWKGQADIARQKATHYPTYTEAIQAYEKAVAEARIEEEAQTREQAEEADARAVQEALSQSSESPLTNQAEEAEEDPSPFV